MKDLNSYIKDNSKHFKIEDGETVVMIYKGFSIVPDRFNPGQETVSYLLQYPDTKKATNWNKGSLKVAAQMKSIQVGEWISITRFGEGMQTTYKIKKVEEPNESPL